jgi:RES domain-containing protein
MSAGTAAAVRLWRIAADTPDWEAHDLSGKGAEISGGRWNRKGRPVVYSASTIALAALETTVHLNADDLPLNRFVVCLEVPPDLWAARTVREATGLPVGWTARPEGKVSLDMGDAWLASEASALLAVPSVIVPEEDNVLVNPRHPDATRLRAFKLRPWFFDPRGRA